MLSLAIEQKAFAGINGYKSIKVVFLLIQVKIWSWFAVFNSCEICNNKIDLFKTVVFRYSFILLFGLYVSYNSLVVNYYIDTWLP